jgi:Holliday junction resolvase
VKVAFGIALQSASCKYDRQGKGYLSNHRIRHLLACASPIAGVTYFRAKFREKPFAGRSITKEQCENQVAMKIIRMDRYLSY